MKLVINLKATLVVSPLGYARGTFWCNPGTLSVSPFVSVSLRIKLKQPHAVIRVCFLMQAQLKYSREYNASEFQLILPAPDILERSVNTIKESEAKWKQLTDFQSQPKFLLYKCIEGKSVFKFLPYGTLKTRK